MGVFDGIIRKIKDTQEVTELTILESMVEVEALNKDQLERGITGSGGNIAPDYVAWYGEYKLTLSSYNLNGYTPDLYLTGAFDRSIKAELIRDTVSITSNVPYSNKLITKYGAEILQLTKQNQKIYAQTVYDDLNYKFKAIWR